MRKAIGAETRRTCKSILSKKDLSADFGDADMEEKLPFSCPVCARNTEYPFSEMVEGARLTCPYCKLTITLHGHMLEYVKKEMERIRKTRP